MSGFERYQVEVFKEVFQERSFDTKEMLTINGVAVSLGVSVRTLRRMIKNGSFPNSHIHKGTTAYWQRQFVRKWERDRLQNEGRKARSRRYANLAVIDDEDEKQFARKSLEDQAVVQSMREMRSLLKADPNEFARQHPKLRQWLKDKGLL